MDQLDGKNLQEDLKQEESRLRSMKIIWFALAWSQVAYGFVVESIHGRNRESPLEWNSTLALQAIGVAVVVFFASVFVPRKILAGRTNISRDDIKILDMQAPFIVQLALNEAICIMGLMLAFVNENPKYLYPFLVVSLAHAVYRFPASKPRLISFYFN